MDRDLANYVEGAFERFIPELMKGELTEAQHLGRYWWAAGAVTSGRVLDAGCGSAYGSVILARAGAAEVIGVDVASAVLDAARSGMPDNVTLQAADLRSLPHPDDYFGLVVCLEVVEHFQEPEAMLDELARVLAPGGVLVLSSPNREMSTAENPHHFHEYTPDELRSTLQDRFANVCLYRQEDWLSSAVLRDETHRAEGGVELDASVRKVVRSDPDEASTVLAVAGDSLLPSMVDNLVITEAAEPKRWLGLWDEQQQAIRERELRIEELLSKDRHRRELQTRLADVEATNARIPDLESELAEMYQALDLLRSEHDRMRRSASWRITSPLRRIKREWILSRRR